MTDGTLNIGRKAVADGAQTRLGEGIMTIRCINCGNVILTSNGRELRSSVYDGTTPAILELLGIENQKPWEPYSWALCVTCSRDSQMGHLTVRVTAPRRRKRGDSK